MVKCKQCGLEIEVNAALEHQIEQRIIEAEQQKHAKELAQATAAAAEAARKEAEAALASAEKQLAGEIELAKKAAADELELEKRRLAAQAESAQKRAAADQELAMQRLQEESAAEKTANKQLREQLSALMQEVREERKARENAELEMQKKLHEEADKIRETALKEADERQRLNLAARDKTIQDLQKALDDAQRKAAQGSQQLQGEVMELDLEDSMTKAFPDDDIVPVAKGVKGGDIKQVVKSPKGVECGVMLWEIKRTKHWTEGWIAKLKGDLRAEKANIPVIVTEVLPKQIEQDMGLYEGVWLCKPRLALVLAALLRKSLLDVGLQKALAENQGTKAESLYGYVTGHEFAHQIESMLETYMDMQTQITKERIAFEKQWTQREGQARKLLMATATIIGGMQGRIGQSSMPRIKGLELLDSGDGDDSDDGAGQVELL